MWSIEEVRLVQGVTFHCFDGIERGVRLVFVRHTGECGASLVAKQQIIIPCTNSGNS